MTPQQSPSGSQQHPKKKQQQMEQEYYEEFWQPLSAEWRRQKQTTQAARARSRSSAPHIQQSIYAAPWQANQVMARYHQQCQPQPKQRPQQRLHPPSTPTVQPQPKVKEEEEKKEQEENDSSSTEVEDTHLARKLLAAESRWEAQQQTEGTSACSSSSQNT